MPSLQQAAGWGFAELWQMAKDYLAANIGEPLAFGLRAVGYLLVAGVLGLLAGANNWRHCIDAVAVLGFAAMSLAAGIDLVRAAGDTAQDCQNYLIAFVPVYSGIAAAGGQTAGALVYSGMFFAMAQFLAAVIGKLLLPVLEIYFCFAACACVWGSRAVEEAAALFSKCLHWLLKVCGAVFSFVLGLQSVLAGTADSAALRTGKSVLQGAVPVVGDAAAAALTGAAAAVQMLKGSLALAALLALGASFTPILLHCLLYSLAFSGAGIAALASGQKQCGRLCRLYAEGAGLCGSVLVRIFWPENGFKPVINAVLALYIITAAVQIIRVADWAGIAAELAPASDSSSVSDSEVGAYRRTLTDEAAAQALRDVLAASGIEAAIARTDTGWQVTLVHAADGQKAEALLAANCGTIPYEITAGGTAP